VCAPGRKVKKSDVRFVMKYFGVVGISAMPSEARNQDNQLERVYLLDCRMSVIGGHGYVIQL